MEPKDPKDPIAEEIDELFADYTDSDRPLEYDETMHLEVTADFPFQPEQW